MGDSPELCPNPPAVLVTFVLLFHYALDFNVSAVTESANVAVEVRLLPLGQSCKFD